MERAAKLVKKNLYSKALFTDDDLARAIWPTAVGKAIATHTTRLKLVRTTLVVEVEDAIWQRQLFPLSSQIVERIRRITASEIVKDIEFRVGLPRRQPARSEHPARASFDEAETIQDPMLKKVYKLSRKKVTA